MGDDHSSSTVRDLMQNSTFCRTWKSCARLNSGPQILLANFCIFSKLLVQTFLFSDVSCIQNCQKEALAWYFMRLHSPAKIRFNLGHKEIKQLYVLYTFPRWAKNLHFSFILSFFMVHLYFLPNVLYWCTETDMRQTTLWFVYIFSFHGLPYYHTFTFHFRAVYLAQSSNHFFLPLKYTHASIMV